MSLTTQPASGRGALTLAVTARWRWRPLDAALVATVLVIGCAGLARGAGTAAASDGSAAELPVGHTVKRIAVPEVTPFPPGAETLRDRMVDVHLWYPADPADVSAGDKAVYTSALHRRLLIPKGETEPIPQWDPLSWSFKAEIARAGAAIDPHGQPFPVIVFSHGSVNDPINYAHLLERIAAAGFVVAAPSHVTDTQEDVRIDFINQQARQLVPPRARLFACNDGAERALPVAGGDCSRPNNIPGGDQTVVARRMAERVRDISKVLDELPAWFGARADVSKAGVMGHSRGTLSGIAAAAGSSAWGIEQPNRRVKAVMGMAGVGTRAVTLQPNLAAIRVPTLLVAGVIDLNSALSHNQALFNQIACPVAGDPLNPTGCAHPEAEKSFVVLPKAHHRSFISTFCDQTQATAAITQLPNTNGQANPRTIFETNAVTNFLSNVNSGRAMDYCSVPTFTTPVDIRPLVRTLTNGFCVTGELVDPIPGPCTTSANVPTTGLDDTDVNEEEEVKRLMTELAVEFFNAKLERDSDGDGVSDAADNCRNSPNGDQTDADGDRIGDACDSDRDGDAIANTTDNCPDIANPGQADTDRDGSGDACDPTPQGTTPPAIAVPGHITVDATGPSGATVTYTVSATDDIEGPTSAACTPSAGSLFAIGDTVVDCDSTDAAGNTANATFVVTVLSAKQQLANLITKVVNATNLPAAIKTQLIAKLQSLTVDFDPSNPQQRTAACRALTTFTTVVRFVAPPAQAAEWTADANRIRAVLAC